MPPYRTARHASVTPSIPSSASSIRSQPISNASPSQVYSEPRIPSEEPSYLSSDNGTSSDTAEVDSLADASEEAVEQRALDLLALQDEGLLFGNSTNSTTAVGGSAGGTTVKFTAKDVPRKQVPLEGEAKEGVENALAFLRRCVMEAEASDFIYKTPLVFGPPLKLDGRKGAGEGELNMIGGGDNVEEGTAWLDTAFNIESYGHQGGPSSSGGSSTAGGRERGREAEGEGEYEEGYTTFFDETEGGLAGATGGLAYMDLEPGGMVGGAGMPFLREGEEEMVGGGFGLGGGGSRRGYQ